MYRDVAAVKTAITGPIPSISTPFLKNGDIDWKSLSRMIDFMVGNGAPALLLTFGDSLFTLLSDKEVGELTAHVVKETAGRAMVIACGKQMWQGEMLRFAEYCKEVGADVFIPVPPDWAQSCDPVLLADFYEAAARVMPVMVLTALMSNRGVPLQTFRLLMERKVEGFMGVKDDTPSPYGRRLATLLDGKYAFMSGGRMENHMDVAPYKVDGYLSIFERFAPKPEREYWKAYTAGDMQECARVIETYEVPFMDMISSIPLHFDAMIHGMMEIMGLCERWRRLPYTVATDAQMDVLRGFLQEKGLL